MTVVLARPVFDVRPPDISEIDTPASTANNTAEWPSNTRKKLA